MLHSLLLSRDDDVIRVLRRVLNDMEIEVDVCTSAERAAEELARRKYDAVIVDCDDVEGAHGVLRNLRTSSSNKTSTAFAIIGGATSMRSAFEMGANLALEKPITADRAKHSFRAAQGLMLQERRRYHRHPVEMAVTLRLQEKGKKHEFQASAYDLSVGGMAVQVKSPLPAHEGLATLHFVLPGTHNWIEIAGTVAWADGEGRAGVHFENVPAVAKEHLEKWSLQQSGGGKPKPAKVEKTAKRRFFF
jgi:CheY-like chemotaxis protein